tara:strand:- start:233 stop:724 length:492 start_codon:yes stop_codon:yes gene_type:complete
MKGLFLALTMAALLFLPGCGNLSPRQQQEIDNQNGRIGEIENLANSMKAEVGNLKTQNEIQDSEIGQMQQGLANWQSNYENSGVQIFSGPGGITVAVIGLLVVSTIAVHYRGSSKKHEKTSEILAEKITSKRDPRLEDEVFQAAMYTDVEENVLRVMSKHQRR